MKVQCVHSGIVLLLLGVLASYPNAHAAELAKPSSDFLAAALVNQVQSVGASLQVRSFSYPLGGPTKGASWYDVEYTRTPSILHVREKRGVFDSSRLEDRSERSVIQAAFNLETQEFRSLTTQSDGESVGRIAAGSFGDCFSQGFPIVDPPRFPIGLRPLFERIKLATISDTTEEIDGYKCWRADIVDPDQPVSAAGHPVTLTYSVWLDPDIGYAPRRITYRLQETSEVGSAPKVVTSTYNFLSYRSISSGAWFPSRVTIVHEGSEQKGWITEVTSVSTGASVSADALKIGIPSGTRVFKLPEGVYVTMP